MSKNRQLDRLGGKNMSNNELGLRPLLYCFLDVDDLSNFEIHLLQILGTDMCKSVRSRDPMFPKARKKTL